MAQNFRLAGFSFLFGGRISSHVYRYRSKLQIEFGLLCDAQGAPVAVEVFQGKTVDPMTVGVQIEKLKDRFGLARVVLVGDRAMLTEARITEEVKPAGLNWIGALRCSAIRALVESGAVQMSRSLIGSQVRSISTDSRGMSR